MPNDKTDFILNFSEIHLSDLKAVGGKNASLGELFNELSPKGILIPDGFAITVSAYWEFIYSNKLFEPLSELMNGLDKKNLSNLTAIGKEARALIMKGIIPESVVKEILGAYLNLCDKYKGVADVAVRSSATAEDLPTASFAGQHESYLNVSGKENLMNAVKNCYASMFTDRAIKYREDNKFKHMQVALSVGVQKMVRSDMAASGIAFTIEPETGFKNIIHIAATWGLGETIVKGEVNPDEFYIFKPTFEQGKNGIVQKKMGTKSRMMTYAAHTDHQPGTFTATVHTPNDKSKIFAITDEEVNLIAKWCLLIENHYGKPMDIEWAKDGLTQQIYIVQARPETVHTMKNPSVIKEYKLKKKGKVITTGNSVGNKIASGIVRIVSSPSEAAKLKKGEILVTETTNPDWNPLLKKAGAIITAKGGRTSHASIVARELGIVAVVGTENATKILKDGQQVTVDCHEGKTGTIYEGLLEWEEKEIDFSKIKMPEKTQPMLILGDPDQAFRYSFYPNSGIGLMRMEFIISNSVQIHPMALVNFNTLKNKNEKDQIEKLTQYYPDKETYFVDKLSQSIATIACAFYPKDVIVRMSDFKTNEYGSLIGGKEFEADEENPMLGFRGASRYYNDRYKEGFRLECEALKKVRDEMGLTNVKLMIPFCRTVEEGKKVVALMSETGLKRGKNKLEIYVMAEIPSNVLLAEEFAKVFDGFSIGSNDLTQLTLGIDRDNAIISDLFNEKNNAPKQMITMVIQKAKKAGAKIGLCGQAPSDFPEFARFLVEQGIDSISFTPDALLKGIENINEAEKDLKQRKKIPNVISN